MQAEVLAIGDEVLAGFTINTNASFISQRLMEIGIDVVRHEVMQDDPSSIQQSLKAAMQRSEVVICSGGLGPTLDDLTRRSIADLFGCSLSLRQEVADDLQRRYGDRLVSQEDQATVPEKAEVFLNTVGTAPGLVLQSEKGVVIFVPGVPVEMRAMMRTSVLPYLSQRFQQNERRFYKKVHFCLVTESRVDAAVRPVAEQYPDFDYGVYPSQGLVSVHLSTVDANENEARERLEAPAQALREALGERYFEAEHGLIQEAVQTIMIERGLTLGTAESCTGGSIAAAITQVPGASEYFQGSIVSYSNEIKMKVLGVSEETLATHGAVSEETVIEMARGACERLGTDYSIAVSGVAGPGGGSEKKPVGTVWIAIGHRGESPRTRLLEARGTREAIVMRSVQVALGELWISLTASSPVTG